MGITVRGERKGKEDSAGNIDIKMVLCNSSQVIAKGYKSSFRVQLKARGYYICLGILQ